jgi:hypothetical protein
MEIDMLFFHHLSLTLYFGFTSMEILELISCTLFPLIYFQFNLSINRGSDFLAK